LWREQLTLKGGGRTVRDTYDLAKGGGVGSSSNGEIRRKKGKSGRALDGQEKKGKR